MIEPDRPLVSVIMPCYKMGRYVGDAVDSIGAQSYSHWEVLAVDDCGPEDGTHAIVSAFARTHATHRVELIRHEINQGVSAARNTALRAARGEYVAFLDPDDVWLPQHLELHLTSFQGNPELGVSASPTWKFTKSSDQRWSEQEFFCSWERELFPYSLGLRNGIVTSAVVLRRNVCGKNLHFDEMPELQHVEDWDLWLRLAQAGVRFVLRDEPTCLYRKHSEGATSKKEMMRERMRALVRKHSAVFFEYYWLASPHLNSRLCVLEDQIRRLYVEPPDLVSRTIRKIRRWFRRM